jgi:hypothetical protein
LAKDFNTKDINKEMFPVYGGKCLSRKAFHSWVKKCGRCFATDEQVETEERMWLSQQSKVFYAAGFDALVKRWDKCISIGGGYVDKNKCFSQVRISHVLRFMSIYDLLNDCASYIPSCLVYLMIVSVNYTSFRRL